MDAENITSLRFSKESAHNIKQAGWSEYNADDYGVYRVEDEENNVVLTIRLIREDNDVVFRVEGDTIKDEPFPRALSLFLFFIPHSEKASFSVEEPISLHSGIVVLSILPHSQRADSDSIHVSFPSSSFRLVVRDDPQTTYPQDCYSRGTPLSLHSPSLQPNPSFANRLFLYGTANASLPHSLVIRLLREDLASFQELNHTLLASFYRSSPHTRLLTSSRHSRALPPSLLPRLSRPFYPTLPNEVAANASLLLLQRVMNVMVVFRYDKKAPFSIDFALIEEHDEDDAFFSVSDTRRGMSLHMQMRTRLLTGFELSSLLADRCDSFSSLSPTASAFRARVETSFALHFDGLRAKEVAAALFLFSNTLASIVADPRRDQSNRTRWFLQQGSTRSSPECGFEEGFVLLALAEWDPAWALQLLHQLVLTIADSPREPDCPPSFLLALDRLLQLQPLTPDRPPPPAHRAVPELLPPLLHLTQRWLEHTEASVKLLYRAPGATGATGATGMSVAATSWALFASVTLQQLLGFLAAEPEMQERLRRRVATSEKRMVKWMWVEARRRFEDVGAWRGRTRSTALVPWVLGVGTVGNVRVDSYLDVLMRDGVLSGEHGIGCGEVSDVSDGDVSDGGNGGNGVSGVSDVSDGGNDNGERTVECSCMDGWDANATSVFVIDNFLVLRSIHRRVLERHAALLYSDVGMCGGREA